MSKEVYVIECGFNPQKPPNKSWCLTEHRTLSKRKFLWL